MSKIHRSLKVLAAIIKRIEDDADFVDKLETLLDDERGLYAAAQMAPIAFDIFDEFTKNGRKGLESMLGTLNDMQLKFIIREHGLDSKKLAQKWKSKERLMTLILDRVEAKIEKGDIFLNFGRERTGA